MKEYTEEDKEKKREYARNLYHKNKSKNLERIRENERKNYQKKKEEMRKKGRASYHKRKGTDKYKETSKKYQEENKEKRKQSSNEYRKAHKKEISRKRTERMQRDPAFKLRCVFSSRLLSFLKGKRKSKSSQKMLGCTWEEFRIYIENQFAEGMTWENHGQFGWHIDHIIPLASASTLEEVEALCHYTNLQPLWWQDNLAKSDKIE